ncbi:phage GP46 family protein [Salmonella enterica]|nr:phage GP46 family protein [Salmonella enterica]
MADVAIVWRSGHGDLVLNGTDLLTDGSIETAVIISLFTDRRAQPSDPVPDGTTDRRGWWADSFRKRPIGSRLWLLSREKTLASVVERTAAYADEALAWLKPAGLVTSVTCTAARVAHDRLRLSVSLVMPGGARRPMIFEADLKGV